MQIQNDTVGFNQISSELKTIFPDLIASGFAKAQFTDVEQYNACQHILWIEWVMLKSKSSRKKDNEKIMKFVKILEPMNNWLRILHYTSWSVFVALTMAACVGPDEGESEDVADKDSIVAELHALEKEVIDVHDEIMPRMAILNNAHVKLIRQREDDDLSAEQRTILHTAILHLEEADSLMWDWMHNYSRPDYEGNLDSIRIYLANEKVTVLHMKEKFLSSMAEGEALLVKNKGNDN